MDWVIVILGLLMIAAGVFVICAAVADSNAETPAAMDLTVFQIDQDRVGVRWGDETLVFPSLPTLWAWLAQFENLGGIVPNRFTTDPEEQQLLVNVLERYRRGTLTVVLASERAQ